MARYRPPEYCCICGKQLIAIYKDQSHIPLMQRVIGDTFMGYKECDHKKETSSPPPELTPQEIDEINREAEEYAKSQYVWPLNKHGEKMTQMVGQVNPPFFRKQIEPIKKHYAAAITSERLKHRAEIQAYRDGLNKIIDLYPNTESKAIIALNDMRQTAFDTLNQFK
jgi:hypothetical protein